MILGNTIIVVEHDEDTIFSSDYLIDIGPGAGVHGGEVVVADYLRKAAYLKEKRFRVNYAFIFTGREKQSKCLKKDGLRKGSLKVTRR